MKYCKASDFQKTVGQLIAGLKIQQEELSNLRGLFQELDKDRNGSLSRQELTDGLNGARCLELFQMGGEDNTKDFFDTVDQNKDGKIEFAEFLQAAVNHQSKLNKEIIETSFKALDLDGDGKLSMAELENVFSSNYNAHS